MLKRLLTVLATGYILTFYSEQMFWAHVRPADTLIDYILAWLLYSLLAFVFLSIIEHFKVRSLWALFLCGAAFGWLAEGLIVQTTYESLPLSISFTGLSWHAILSVCIGWYAVRRALRRGMGATLGLASGIGLFYGLWAISWWMEPGDVVASPTEFASYAAITTLLAIMAYWIVDRSGNGFTAGRRAKWIIGGLLVLYFIFITVPTAPIALILLPLLLGSAYWVVYLVTTPLGFLLFGISAFQVWRAKINNSPAAQGL